MDESQINSGPHSYSRWQIPSVINSHTRALVSILHSWTEEETTREENDLDEQVRAQGEKSCHETRSRNAVSGTRSRPDAGRASGRGLGRGYVDVSQSGWADITRDSRLRGDGCGIRSLGN